MKRVFYIIILSVFLVLNMSIIVNAVNSDMSKLELKVIDADEDYTIYILLPKKYIKYAIHHDGLNIEYDGSNTLKNNTIPSINIDSFSVMDETYVDNGTEYVQIKLNKIGDNRYVFKILSKYTDMDMIFRAKSATKDNLLIISNFRMKDNKCEIEYNYLDGTVKTDYEKKYQINIGLKWWQILCIIGIVLVVLYIYKKSSRNYRG